MTLGEIVKNYREEHNISMDAFAAKCKLSKGYISMLEKNKNPNTGKPIRPSLITIKSVASAMNVDVNDIISLLEDQEILIPKDGNDEFEDHS